MSGSPDSPITLQQFTDLTDRDDLFETLPNERISQLSRSDGRVGFSNSAHVLKATGITSRRMLRQTVTANDLVNELLNVLLPASNHLRDRTTILLAHSHCSDTAARDLALRAIAQHGLQESRIAAFNTGCTGFLQLLQQAQALLAQPQPPARVLLLNVETPETWHCAADRQFCGLVGAAATGCVVLHSETGLKLHSLHTGTAALLPTPHLVNKPLFTRDQTQAISFRGEMIRRTVMRMYGEGVYVHGIERLLNELHSAADAVRKIPGPQPPVIVPHQPGGKLLRAFRAVARQSYPDWPILNHLPNRGNTISATIPAQLANLATLMSEQTAHQLTHGQRIILLAAGIDMQRPADHLRSGRAILQYHAVDSDVSAAVGQGSH